LRVAEQVKGGQEERSAGVEFGGGVGQLPFDLGSFAGDGGQLLLDLCFGSARLADQVEVLLLFGVQLAQTGREALLGRCPVR
jgi:hypothetical protein